MRALILRLSLALCIAMSVMTASDAQDSYTPDRLDQLVAPIALFPDDVLSQILMASTYPLEVVEADRWVKSHPNLSESKRAAEVANQTWDPSVTSLTAFPDVLKQMSDNLQWTQDLGEAFLAQEKGVCDAIQRMRQRAEQAGNLKSSPQENVTNNGSTIVIASTSPETVYIPSYDPTVIYGSAWAPPSWYYPAVMNPWPGYVAGTMLSWGIGYACGRAMFGGFNWGAGSCYVNHNWGTWGGYRGGWAHSNINVNRNTNVNWTHNAYHRGGVNYRNTSLRQQYGRPNGGYRGYGGGNLGTTRPGTGTNRPGTGTGIGSNRPGTGTGNNRPGTGTGIGSSRPGTGTGNNRPGTGTGIGSNRPGTGTGSNRPGTGTGNSRPGTGTGIGSNRPGTGTGNNRPGTGTGTTRPGTGTGIGSGSGSRPNFGNTSGGSRPNFGNTSGGSRPSFGNTSGGSRPSFNGSGSGSRPSYSGGASSRPSSGAFGNYSSGAAQSRASARGAQSRGASGGGSFQRASSAPSRSVSRPSGGGGGRGGGGRRR